MGRIVRTAFVFHATWLTNSAAHTWGYRNDETNDLSANLWWVALLSFSGGWRNNHHAYQRFARHGLRWWKVDPTYLVVCLLGLLGLATENRAVRMNPAEFLARAEGDRAGVAPPARILPGRGELAGC